jgi:hypothetical protein
MEQFKKRSTFTALAAAAVTALGLGGAALAQSNGPDAAKAPVQHPPAKPGADKPDGHEK